MTNTLRTTLLRSAAAVALLAAGTTAASAATTVNGGGSTLAAPLYEAIIADIVSSSYTYNYFPSGSSAAQNAFLSNTISDFGASPTPTGSVDFGASDATLTTTQIGTFVGPKAMIQLPTVGTPITLAFNLPTKARNGGINLSDAQVCAIFGGQDTNWSQVTGVGVTQPLKVIYRSDGSGTSFLLTQHLAATCQGDAGFASNFTASTTFASIFPGSTVPSNFVGASGSPNVSLAIGQASTSNTTGSTVGAIGYISPDYTKIATVNLTNTTSPFVASVDGEQPNKANVIAALGTTAAIPTNPSDQTEWVPAVPNPANGYPIVGYTTMEVASCYANASVGAGVVNLLTNLYNDTNSGVGQIASGEVVSRGFVPVPGSSNTTGVVAGTLAAAIYNTFLTNTGTLAINTVSACTSGR